MVQPNVAGWKQCFYGCGKTLNKTENQFLNQILNALKNILFLASDDLRVLRGHKFTRNVESPTLDIYLLKK